jgi:hypothetical protein
MELMEAKSKIFTFALVKVTTEQFAIIDECYDDKGEYKVVTNIRFGADDEKKMLAVFTAFKFECDEKPFIIIEAGCHFNIEPNSWNDMLNPEDQSLLVPKELLRHLAMLTVGTSRGILHAKTENTSFNKFVLPTINVSAMIHLDSTFEFKHQE